MSEKSAGADHAARGGAGPEAARLSRTYLDALRANDAASAYRVAAGALGDGMSLAALDQEVIAPAMHELGRLWERGAVTIADEHLATALTNRVLDALRPPLGGEDSVDAGPRPRAMLATVQGERHSLGLRMASDLLEDAGFETVYLGADVPTGSLLRAVEDFSPGLLGLSATMPESAPTLAGTVAAAREKHPRLSMVVGGQAIASSRIEEAVPVENLEMLVDLVRSA